MLDGNENVKNIKNYLRIASTLQLAINVIVTVSVIKILPVSYINS